MASGVLTAAFRFLVLAIHWLYATIVAERNLPSLSSKLVPAPGFEPGAIGLKDRCSNQAELRRHEYEAVVSGL